MKRADCTWCMPLCAYQYPEAHFMIVLSFYKYHGDTGPALASQLRFTSQSHTSNATSPDCRNAFRVPSCAGFKFCSCKRYVVSKDTISWTLAVFVTTWDNNFVIVPVADWDEELRQKGYQDILFTGKMESDLRMIMDNVTLPHQALS